MNCEKINDLLNSHITVEDFESVYGKIGGDKVNYFEAISEESEPSKHSSDEEECVSVN